MNNQVLSTPKEGLKQTQVLHLALILGPILMSTMLWFAIGTNDEFSEPTIFPKVFPIVLGSIFAAAFYIYKIRVSQRGEIVDLLTKVEHYRSTSILRWAMLEGGALISMLFYFFMENNFVFLILFAIALIGLAYSRPSKNQFAEDYNLSNQEISELN